MIWEAIPIILLLILIVCFIIRLIRLNEIMDRLDEILEQAIRGTFTEESFDESKLSRFESKLVKYIAQNRLAKGNLKAQRDEIEKIVSDISHQTKTPIANILLYTELLQEQNLDEETTELVQRVAGQSERLKFITDSLVKVSRLENGIIQLKPKTQSLLPLVEDVASEYEQTAARQGIKLTVIYKDPVPEAFYDYKWTREALSNIVDNAIKYTAVKYTCEEYEKDRKGTYPEICISIVAYELYHMIEVRDNGIGIPESEQAEVFQRFYRGSQVRGSEGVGIGLYLAREIISQEGGYIRVRSHTGDGTEFGLFLRAN